MNPSKVRVAIRLLQNLWPRNTVNLKVSLCAANLEYTYENPRNQYPRIASLATKTSSNTGREDPRPSLVCKAARTRLPDGITFWSN